MKNISIFILILFVLGLTNCNNSDRDYQKEPYFIPEISRRDSVYSNFLVERDNTITKLNTHLEEIEADIEETRAKRKAERNEGRISQYDADLEIKERNRTTIKEKLDAAGHKTEAEWNEFKREIDDFFDEDNNIDD